MKKQILVLNLIGWVSFSAVAQDHGHLNLGAVTQGAGSRLTFDNGADFTGPYVKTLTYTNAGKYANLYQGNITLTALHSVNAFGEPTPGAAAPGAFLVGEIVSVTGPEGGAFQFWETNSTVTPAVSIPTGSTNSNFRFEVSDKLLGAGEPGGDAFGHIHGRRFTVTRPGLYTVGFRAYDYSTNGPAGSAIHTPSDVIEVHFQGNPGITGLETEQGVAKVAFGATTGFAWQVESTDDLALQNWLPVEAAITGADELVEVFDQRESAPQRFYRVVGTPVSP